SKRSSHLKMRSQIMESFHKLQVNYSLKQVALVKKHKKTLSTLSISLLLSVIVSQALALPLTENKKSAKDSTQFWLCGAGYITDYAVDEPYASNTITTKIKLDTEGFDQPTGNSFDSWIDGTDAGKVITIATYPGNWPEAWQAQARLLSTIQNAIEMRNPVRIYTTGGPACSGPGGDQAFSIRVCSDQAVCGGKDAPPHSGKE
ncbi:hypothetical protein, partial [Pseudomonas aeruginosa]|uniref:hypothetical protein n=6 Tax=Gammaproteobacteria TaxID=1236 RepID=UPI003D27C4BD